MPKLLVTVGWREREREREEGEKGRKREEGCNEQAQY